MVFQCLIFNINLHRYFTDYLKNREADKIE